MNKEDIVIFQFNRDAQAIDDIAQYFKNIKEVFPNKTVIAIENTMKLYDIHGKDLSDYNRELLEETISKFKEE
jgi:hypothetical protein